MTGFASEAVSLLDEHLYEGKFSSMFDGDEKATSEAAEMLEPIATSVLSIVRTGHENVEFTGMRNDQGPRLFVLPSNWETMALSLRNPDLGMDYMYNRNSNLFGLGCAFRLECIMVVMTEPAIRNQIMLLFDRKPERNDGVVYDWDDGFVELSMDRFGRARFRGYGVEHPRLIDQRGGFSKPAPAYVDIDAEQVFKRQFTAESIVSELPKFANYIESVADHFDELCNSDS